MKLRESFAHLFHPRRSNNHRPRLLHPHAMMYLAAIVVGFSGLLHSLSLLPTQYETILGFASSISQSQVIEQTNAQRAQHGLPALTPNEKLSQAAMAKAQDMMADQYWAHTAPDGTQPWAFIRQAGYSYKVAGENLARDFANGQDMMAAWMASPTHRANILNTRYTEIGIAVLNGTLQGYETTLVVQMFGTPQGAVAAVDTEAAQVTQAPSSFPTEPVVETVDTVETLPTPVPDAASVGQQPTPANTTVLAAALVPLGELQVPPLFTPLQLSKALFLSMIMMIVGTLLYDSLIIGHRQTMRLVGKNLAHIVFFSTIAFLLILFKGGIVG
ncbi:MAG TPA: CAP domain-containing protein [Patescibacteria group bacterium]